MFGAMRAVAIRNAVTPRLDSVVDADAISVRLVTRRGPRGPREPRR